MATKASGVTRDLTPRVLSAVCRACGWRGDINANQPEVAIFACAEGQIVLHGIEKPIHVCPQVPQWRVALALQLAGMWFDA